MNVSSPMASVNRYAKVIEVSKRVRWEVETDVIRGRRFNVATKFLPDGLTLAGALPFLAPDEKVSYGRPVGVTLGPDGSLLVADDVGNVIWRVTGA